MIPVWGMSSFLSNPLTIPARATQVKCATQSTGWSCGYHAIFNGWSIALGLKLNLHFKKDWEPPLGLTFFQDVQRTIAAACLGLATPGLIHHFLECIGFVEAGQTLNLHKQFGHTLPIENRRALDLAMDDLEKGDDYTHGDQLLERILASPDSFGLDTKKGAYVTQGSNSWSSLWKPFVKDITVNTGIDWNSMSEHELRCLLTVHSGDYRRSKVAKQYGKAMPYQRLRELFQEKYGTEKIWNHLADRKVYWEWNEAAWDIEKSIRKKANIRCHMKFPKSDASLGMDHMTMAIAAVVQAVNQKQADQEPDKTFRGGFALGGDEIDHNSDLIFGKDAEPGSNGVVSRPRRCFPMPFIFSDGKSAHDVLVLVQEEQPRKEGGRRVCIYVLDTRSAMFRRNLDNCLQRIKQILDKMYWRIGGKDPGSVTFRNIPRFVRVAPQHGNTVCGFHVILNAWIIALGLTPNPKADFQDRYEEIRRFVQIAVAGVLNWRSLVEWLIHRGYVRETDIELVPTDRRFQATVPQTEKEVLRNELQAIFQVQQLEKDYEYDNNVDFSTPNWEFEPGSELDPDEPGLERAMEDIDGISMHERFNSSESIGELLELAQETRRKAKRCVWRSKHLQQNKSRRRFGR